LAGQTKVIDAHAHVGRFGSWANVSCTAEELLAKMDAADVEKAVLFAPEQPAGPKGGEEPPEEVRGIRVAEPTRQKGRCPWSRTP